VNGARGLRTVALFEAAKGALVLLAGFGAFELVHHAAQGQAEALVRHAHLNPASRIPRIFLEAATGTSLTWLAAGAAAYACGRFVEAYGLWRERRWARWLGLVSGAIYVPFELAELLREPGWLPAALLGANLAVVALLARSLRRD
jgi:uncharacterized membrane protein (DUF2068 family)